MLRLDSEHPKHEFGRLPRDPVTRRHCQNIRVVCQQVGVAPNHHFDPCVGFRGVGERS
jgi:hypothetical protein